MAELRAATDVTASTRIHVVFVHGLSGDITETWSVADTSTSAAWPSRLFGNKVFWPKWLAEDIDGVGVWALGYPAAKTDWGGDSMHLPDRANNVLARLLMEPLLQSGTIVFVAHSLGGLVVEEVLRTAHRDEMIDSKAASFLARVRKVAFLGTPHRGAILANAMRTLFFLRPSAATLCLALGSPSLRSLNQWYRVHCASNKVDNMILAEGRPEKVFGIRLPNSIGTVVWIDSADGGLCIPVPVDESHTSICKPPNRDSQVYLHIKSFVSTTSSPGGRSIEILEAIQRAGDDVKSHVTDTTAAQTEIIRRLVSGLAVSFPELNFRLGRQVDLLIARRGFTEIDAEAFARALATDVLTGQYVQADPHQKDRALAWCSRSLAVADTSFALGLLKSLTNDQTELAKVVSAILVGCQGKIDEALFALSLIRSPLSLGAAFICVVNGRGFAEAKTWLENAGANVDDLDGNGKVVFVQRSLSEGDFDLALSVAGRFTETDFALLPGALLHAAKSHLMLAVPQDLRVGVLQNVPFDAARFSLQDDPASIQNRRSAIELFDRASRAAAGVDLKKAARHAADYSLWLRLVDSGSEPQARVELADSIKDADTLLNRLHLALQFGIEVDLAVAEREVNRQTALSGGKSVEAALARFSLAFTKNSAAEVVEYLDSHRDQLLQHLDWKSVYFAEIEMLSNSGQKAKAADRLREAINRGITDYEASRLRLKVSEIASDDLVAERARIFEQGHQLLDLSLLVDAYVNVGDWASAAIQSRRLVDLTQNIVHVGGLAVILYNLGELDAVVSLYGRYPKLIDEGAKFSSLLAQAQFELGDLTNAKKALEDIKSDGASSAARRLEVDIAIASGDWDSLQGFVEQEWQNRELRGPGDLLRAGQLAQLIGGPRGRELVEAAAKIAKGDPKILIACYHAATSAGWEADGGVHGWLESAIKLSEGVEDPVIGTMSIEDVVARAPGWDARQASLFEQLSHGEMPAFIVAEALNRTLLDFTLIPALRNKDEKDVRKKPLIFAYSGGRGSAHTDATSVAFDPSALVTVEMLGILEKCFAAFESIVVPHSTLFWLLEERAKVLYHQPSKVEAAKELRRLISVKHLLPFTGTKKPSEKLVAEVGEHLASLLTEASNDSPDDQRQRLVVRGGPIHKPASLMNEEADISTFLPHICAGLDVIEKLVEKGQLTTVEAEHARKQMKARELPLGPPVAINDGAILYIDDLTASYFEFLNLLPKLHRADVTAVISSNELLEADALISFDAKSHEVLAVVNRLRSHLKGGLESGKVKLGPAVRQEADVGLKRMREHPTVALLKLMDRTGAAVSDDRFLNQHAIMGEGKMARPILTTLDLLKLLMSQDVITEAEFFASMASLRSAGYALIPVEYAELAPLILSANSRDGALVETAELRAIRESVLRVRMSSALQVPKELPWLNQLIGSSLLVLKDLWITGFELDAVSAKSKWLLELCDLRGWAHRVASENTILAVQFANWLSLLIVLPANQPPAVKEAYWKWLDSEVLAVAEVEAPDAFARLIDDAKAKVRQHTEAFFNAADGESE